MKRIFLALIASILLSHAASATVVSFEFKARLDEEEYYGVHYTDENEDLIDLGIQSVRHDYNPYNLVGGKIDGMTSNFNAMRDGRFHRGHISYNPEANGSKVYCWIAGIDCSFVGQYGGSKVMGDATQVYGTINAFSMFDARLGDRMGSLFVGDDDSECVGQYNVYRVKCGLSGGGYTAQLTLQTVPVPASLPLLSAGLFGFGVWHRKRRKS